MSAWTEEVAVGRFAARAEHARAGGLYDEALQWAGRSLEQCPGYSSGYVVRGRCLLELGESARALEDLGKAVEVDGENGMALRLLGDALALEGIRDEASAVYERAAAIAGEKDETRLARRILKLGEAATAGKDSVEEAEGIVRGAVPGEAAAEASEIPIQGEFETATMARICEEQGVLDTALKIYATLSEKYPEASLLKGKVAQIRRRIAETSAGGENRK